jgi:hypothetical protein
MHPFRFKTSHPRPTVIPSPKANHQHPMPHSKHARQREVAQPAGRKSRIEPRLLVARGIRKNAQKVSDLSRQWRGLLRRTRWHLRSTATRNEVLDRKAAAAASSVGVHVCIGGRHVGGHVAAGSGDTLAGCAFDGRLAAHELARRRVGLGVVEAALGRTDVGSMGTKTHLT